MQARETSDFLPVVIAQTIFISHISQKRKTYVHRRVRYKYKNDRILIATQTIFFLYLNSSN